MRPRVVALTLVPILSLSFLRATCGFSVETASLSQLYQAARQIRIREGHNQAQPVYKEILRRNPHDVTVSTRIAASTDATLQLFQSACHNGFEKDAKHARLFSDLRSWFIASNFTSANVDHILNVSSPCPAAIRCETLNDSYASAPIYIVPAVAGTVVDFPFALSSITACHCLTALFLLGLTVPVTTLLSCCSESHLQLLKDIGVLCHCENDPDLLLPLLSIMPIDMPKGHGRGRGLGAPKSSTRQTLFIVTDWHPRVLNTLRIFDTGSPSTNSEQEAVMYVGPDSLGLIQHWILHPELPIAETLLDVCTGSGVQALTCLAIGKCKTAVCLDINVRALRFASFSAQLNGFSDSMVFIQGNVLTGVGRVVSDSNRQHCAPVDTCLVGLLQNLQTKAPLSQAIDLITCNPPFIPIPDDNGEIYSTNMQNVKTKHGWFSAGGTSGEDVLSAVLKLARKVLSERGIVAFVSEFFFARDSHTGSLNVNCLLDRLGRYWMDEKVVPMDGSIPNARALLLTNEFPISAALYAQRRADSKDEVNEWMRHLDRVNIAACSPGFLYLQKSSGSKCWTHVAVPKSDLGSLWTQRNTDAIDFTRTASADFFEWNVH